jgi:hypothetical protein
MFSNYNFLSKNHYAAEGEPVCLKIPGPNSFPSPPLDVGLPSCKEVERSAFSPDSLYPHSWPTTFACMCNTAPCLNKITMSGVKRQPARKFFGVACTKCSVDLLSKIYFFENRKRTALTQGQ